MYIIFWVSLFLVFYTFIGYGLLLLLLVKLKRIFNPTKRKQHAFDDLPTCTLVVAAYNEEDFISEKIANTLAVKYPESKLSFLFVTDGSTDRTAEIVAQYPQVKLMHS